MSIFFSSSLSHASDFSCGKFNELENRKLNVLLFDDPYYKYQNLAHYLFSNLNQDIKIQYDIEVVNYDEKKDLRKYDLLLGEYEYLNNIDLPKEYFQKIKSEIVQLYNQQGISEEKLFNKYIHPLDLDTFLVSSIEKISIDNSIFFLETQNQYSFNQSFLSPIYTIKFLNYLKLKEYDLKNPQTQSLFFLLKNRINNSNPNTILGDIEEKIISAKENENIFNIIEDGEYLQDNKSNISNYPLSKVDWNNEQFLNDNNDENFHSYYGFSFLINSKIDSNLACFFLSENLRKNMIFNFSKSISPFSDKDFGLMDINLRKEYLDILSKKNIHEIKKNSKILKFYEKLKHFMFERKSYLELLEFD